jgi:hypothetical protein
MIGMARCATGISPPIGGCGRMPVTAIPSTGWVAQAQVEGLTLPTADARPRGYGIALIDAVR